MSFENAPVTKALMLAYALSSVLVGVFDLKHYLHLQLVPHLSRHHQYWRLVLHHLAFSSSSDLFVAQLLLFAAAVPVERRYGSVKFASSVLVSLALATLLEFAALVLFHPLGLDHISTPCALVFSIIYQYSRLVPATYKYRIFGVPLDNKSLLYLLAAQVTFARLPGSAAAAAIGVLAGQIYRSDLANLKAYRVPNSAVALATRFVLPLIGALRPPRRSNRALPDDPRPPPEVVTTAATTAATHRPVMREWVDELTGTPGIRVPPEQEIAQVTAMFPDVQRQVVVAALQQSPNIQGAVETLLSPM